MLQSYKIDSFEKIIAMLPDTPNATLGMLAEELKAWFDASPEELKASINGVIDDLVANTGASQIGFSGSGLLSTNVAAAILEILAVAQQAQSGQFLPGVVTDTILSDLPGQIKERVLALQSTKADITYVDQAIESKQVVGSTVYAYKNLGGAL
jgi:hypothetical protein